MKPFWAKMREHFNLIPLRNRIEIANSLRPCNKKSIAKCKNLLDSYYRSKLGPALSQKEICNLCFRWMWKGSKIISSVAELRGGSRVRKNKGLNGPASSKRVKTINRCSSRKDLKRKHKNMVTGENIDRPPDKKPRKLNGHLVTFIGP